MTSDDIRGNSNRSSEQQEEAHPLPIMPTAIFRVHLDCRGAATLYEDLRVGTAHLAAHAAEALHRGWKAIAVETPAAKRIVAGRCSRCGAVLFEDERPERIGGGGLRCFDPC